MKKQITAKKLTQIFGSKLPTVRLKNEMEAYSEVLAILEPFSDEARRRIIKATAILLGIPV